MEDFHLETIGGFVVHQGEVKIRINGQYGGVVYIGIYAAIELLAFLLENEAYLNHLANTERGSNTISYPLMTGGQRHIIA